MATIKDFAKREERLTGGHRLCPGCGASITARQILMATQNDVVVANATGCLEVATTIYPFTAWKTPWIHNAFENAAATITGVETAYVSLKKQGRIPKDKEIKFVAFGGDGGTYDIGLQSLSGAMERGHDFVYVCYDNEAYMNTGTQRSSATPFCAATSTSPVGTVKSGKEQFSKDIAAIASAHHIPYVAQSTAGHFRDLTNKAEKAFNIKGPAFLLVLAPCPRGWRYPADLTVEMAKLAVDTCFWPLYEVEYGNFTLNYKPKEKKPVSDWLKAQGRFKHLFQPENKELLDKIQKHVDSFWERYLFQDQQKKMFCE